MLFVREEILKLVSIENSALEAFLVQINLTKKK